MEVVNGTANSAVTANGNDSTMRCPDNPEFMNITLEFLSSDLHIYTEGVLFTIFTIMGVAGNLVTAYIFTRPIMRVGLSVFLCALAISDTGYLVTLWMTKSVPTIVMMAGDNYGTWIIMPYVKFYAYPLMRVFYTNGTWLTVLASIERYLVICAPFNCAAIKSSRFAFVASIVTFLTAFVVNIPAFLEFYITRDIHYYEGEEGPYTIYYRTEPRSYRPHISLYYTIMRISTHFVGPFILLVTLHILIVRELRFSKAFRDLAASQQRQRSVQPIMVMFQVYVGIFLVCHTLPNVNYMLEISDEQWLCKHVLTSAILNDLQHLVLMISAACAFCIYYVSGSRFRQCFAHHILGRTMQNIRSYDGNSLQLSRTPNRQSSLLDTDAAAMAAARGRVMLDKRSRSGNLLTVPTDKKRNSSTVEKNSPDQLPLVQAVCHADDEAEYSPHRRVDNTVNSASKNRVSFDEEIKVNGREDSTEV